MIRFPFFTLILSVCAVVIHDSPALTAALEFERTAISRGELWRVFTGHFTHFGADHLCWDVLTFLAFGSLAEFRSRRVFLRCLFAASILISAGVGFLQPQFLVYRGLSGLDSALFTFVTADLLRDGLRDRDWLNAAIGSLTLAGFVGKSAFELITGETLFVTTSTDFQPVPLAHVLGAVVGVAIALHATHAKRLTVSAQTGSTA